MFTALPVETQEELNELAARFGQPLARFVELDLAYLFDPIDQSDRYGEVCMVVRRPNGRLLTAKKTFYPPEGYRLLTGGIQHGEKVLDALLRETSEETNLEVVVRRFLAAIAYYVPGQQDRPIFYTFAFLLDEVGGTLETLDASEQIEYFREISPQELPERAAFLSQLAQTYSTTLRTNWADWGRFRAVVHSLLAEIPDL